MVSTIWKNILAQFSESFLLKKTWLLEAAHKQERPKDWGQYNLRK